MELHNSYTSSSSSRGINAGATIGYGHKIQTTGNGGSISVSRSNQNTVETIHANGNFRNVNEVHNNTGTMTLSGFNQEGGKVTGNIGKVEVISRQNTSTTTESSKGVNLGISANGVPSSVNINASRTNGNRAFVDNQSTFVVGEGSNLHVGTVENTGAVIGKEGNSTFKIDSYVGKDIQNYDTMTTTGGSIGVSLGGKPKITNVGFNQDSSDKQGITRNTVVGDVEITKAEGSPINRDLGKANETTKDTHRSTNINVESQTIEYATNPGKLKEDIGKAKKEISDVTTAIKESIHDRGDDNRNFFGQLREIRLSETVNNIAGKRLTEAQKSEDVVAAWKDAYKDLGYNLDVRYTTEEDTPEMKDKAGTAYVSKDGVHTIIININAKENSTKAGLIGTLAEEASHIVNGVAGRQIATGTKEKGLESTGRASNAYFQEEYKGSNQNMTYKSDGKIDTSKLGVHVGDKLFLETGKNQALNAYLEGNKRDLLDNFIETLKSDEKYKDKLDELDELNEKLKNLLANNEILANKKLSVEEEKHYLNIYQENNKDKLKVITDEDGSREIVIENKFNLNNLINKLEKDKLSELEIKKIQYEILKTSLVREIISREDFNTIIQTTDNTKISNDIEINNKWNNYTSAVNNTILERQKEENSSGGIFSNNFRDNDNSGNRFVGDVVYYNLNAPNKKYLSIDEYGKTKETDYKSKKPIEQHELVVHPSDLIMLKDEQEKGIPFEFMRTEGARYVTKDNGVTYLEDRFTEVKMPDGTSEYWLQPLIKLETNTLKFEEMTNEILFGKDRDNTRFYYHKNFEQGVIKFKSFEEKKNFFDMYGVD